MCENYERAAAKVPGLREFVSGPFDLSASVLTDRAWLTDRVTDIGLRWGCRDARVNGKLWWYSASSTLAFVAVATAMVTGSAADPSLEGARCGLTSDGYLDGIRARGFIPVDELPAALDQAFSAIVDELSDVSGARRLALWAIASDSISNRCLDVGAALGDRSVGSRFASGLIQEMTSPMPTPRFVDVAGRRFTRRSSCCSIYETGGADMCVSCPRLTPADRRRGLEIAARY